MTGKAMYSKFIDEQMAAMNLPSRTEMVKVLQKLTDIEERLIDLSERFEDYVETQAKGEQKAPAAEKKGASEKPAKIKAAKK
jgi:hypothetical protein